MFKKSTLFKITLILLASNFFSLVLLEVRILYSGHYYYDYMAWNLLLAFVPFLISLILVILDQKVKKFLMLLPLICLWLLFLPNSFYIITDFVHLGSIGDVGLWFDILLLTSFSWNGMLLGFVSLALLQKIINKHFHKIIGWIFIVVSLLLSSFGIYLGRFLRWNSWDILTSSKDLVLDLQGSLSHLFTYEVVFFITAFLLLVYVVINLLSKEFAKLTLNN